MIQNALPLAWLGMLACLGAAASFGALSYALRRSLGLQRWATAYAERAERDLRHLRLTATGVQLLRAQALATLGCAALALALASAWPMLGCAAAACLPPLALARARLRRNLQVAEQLDVGLVAIANALEAGNSLGEALASAAQLAPAPLADELSLVVRETALGVPLGEALGNFATRVAQPTVTAAVATLQVARDTGGELIQALATCAESLRELSRLEGVVRSKTAEGRAQAVVIGIVPVPLFALLDALDPGLLAPVWNTITGHIVLGVATGLWAFAVLLAREIVDVDV